MVVFKAVANATSAADSMPLDAQTDPMNKTDRGLTRTLSGFSNALNISSAGTPQTKQKAANNFQLQKSRASGFSSALNLSSAATPQTTQKAANNFQLQKSRASALKLNSVLQSDGGGKPKGNSTFDKTKKTKSVQWNNQMVLPKAKPSQDHSPKRQRLNTEARLTSFKSFGRAHAGDFDSGPTVRNATFGDFGRQPLWGRDGRLANHPSPMQPNYEQSQDLLSSSTSTNKNATFDLQRPPIHLTSRIDLGKKSRKKSRSDTNQDKKSSIPRSATAHENWFVKNTLGNAL
jgi:hypothetical protein